MEHIGNLHSMENFVGRGARVRTLWVGGSEAALGRSAPLPRLPGGGPLSSVGGSVGTVAGWTLQRGFPADSGGEPGFLWKKAGGKNTRAPPWTRVFIAARSHSLGLGLVGFGTVEGLFPPGC